MASDLNFKTGFREIGYRYELLDRNFNVVGDITDRVGDCTIEHNSFTSINRTAKFNLKEYTGEVPATYKGNYQKQWWVASNPNRTWTTTDCWLNESFISFPKYKLYDGANHELTTGSKPTNTGSGTIPSEGYTAMGSGIDPTFTYNSGGGMLGNNFASQSFKHMSSSGYAIMRSDTATSVGNKRVHFCGFFKASDTPKPDVFVYFSGGSNPVELVRVPDGNITIIDVSSSGTSDDWKWFGGYYDMVVHGGYTTARMAIGAINRPFSIVTYDQFYFDFDRSTPFRFRADATLELDVSIPDALNVANEFRANLSNLNSTIDRGTTGLQVVGPRSMVEWNISYDGGSNWIGWESASLEIINFKDARNTRFKIRFTCESYTQSFKPKLRFWQLQLGAITNIANTNKDKVDFTNHRIKPYLRIKDKIATWQEYPLGVFLMSSPKRSDSDGGVNRDVEAYDQLTILSQSKLSYPLCLFPDRDNPDTPTSRTGGWAKAVKDLLLGDYPIVGFIGRHDITPGQKWLPNYVNIPEDVYTLPSKSRGRNFKMGETWLSVLNQLLNTAGYTPLFCNSKGVLTSIPYVPPDQQTPKYTYKDDEMSIIFTEASEELDTFEVANQFVAYQPADQNGIELVARYTNDNQGHPSSVPTQGRTITDYRDASNMESQSEIDRYIYKVAYEASQVYGQINFTTALDPGHEESDVVYLRYQDLGIDGKYVETAWSMNLTDDPHMTHRLRKVVSI